MRIINRSVSMPYIVAGLVSICSVFNAFGQPSDNDGAVSVDVVEWKLHGNDYYEQRYSPLSDINNMNVANLSLAWYFDLPESRGQEATPLMIGGVVYTTSAWNHVHALSATTGEVLWEFDPKVPKSTGVKGCCGAVTRGLAYSDGTVFQATLDGRLIALDAKSGAKLWSVNTVDTSKNYTITGAPRVARGKVYIGNGGAEYGVQGYVSAYDAKTGMQVWRFYTVPPLSGDTDGVEPLEMMRETWSETETQIDRGGTAWDSIVYDPDTNSLIFGVGNGSPWNPSIRSPGGGDNLFLSSIVSVDADSGEYKWHYQTTPGEAWDYTATQPIILAELDIDGKPTKVAIQAPKNGFLYIIDRTNGKLISADNFVDVTWASHVDLESGRPVVNPEAEYWKTGKPALVKPSWMGGHNWHSMSLNPKTNVLFLPTQESAFPYLAENEQSPSRLAVNLGVDTKAAGLPDDPAVIKAVKEATFGSLVAKDLTTGKDIWRVNYPGVWNGGVLSTEGDLVFQGAATGYFNAYNAKDGSLLWRFNAQGGIVAAPISYKIGGEQYVAVNVGWGGIMPLMTGVLTQDSALGYAVNKSRLLVFKMGGKAQLPADDRPPLQLQAHKSTGDAESIRKGYEVYDRYCVVCHGAGAIGGGVVPDLRFSGFIGSPEAWKSVVLGGVLESRGMVSFKAELDEGDVENVREYILDRVRYAQETGDTVRPYR